MSDEIICREYTENDMPFLTDIVIKVWGFDDILSEKNAKLIAELNLYSFLNTATFAKVALKDKRPVGFLIGKITNSKQNSIYLNNYILSKINLYFCFYIWGFAPYPTSFVATKKQKGYI